MKKKLIIGVAILSMAIGFVGCNNSTSTTLSADTINNIDVQNTPTDIYVTINKARTSDVNSENYIEYLGFTNLEHTLYTNIEDVEKQFCTIFEVNEDIITELTQNYISPTNIKLTGEILDGKTYFYFNGYATNLEGVTEDYNKKYIFNFDLDTNIFEFNIPDKTSLDESIVYEEISIDLLDLELPY